MSNKDLTIQTRILFNPEKDTDKAKRAADKLVDIVKQNGWAKSFGGGKEHIFYEGWQTLGKYYNVSVATGEVEPVELNNVQGFKAKAWVVDNKTGVRVGEAEAYCMRDEGNWRNKPLFQLASMAQTRAGSKALRQIFGFVVALAGYEPTPAEEMIAPQAQINEKMTTVQKAKIVDIAADKGKSQEDLDNAVRVFNLENWEEMTKSDADKMLIRLESLPDAPIDITDEDIEKADKVISG